MNNSNKRRVSIFGRGRGAVGSRQPTRNIQSEKWQPANKTRGTYNFFFELGSLLLVLRLLIVPATPHCVILVRLRRGRFVARCDPAEGCFLRSWKRSSDVSGDVGRCIECRQHRVAERRPLLGIGSGTGRGGMGGGK